MMSVHQQTEFVVPRLLEKKRGGVSRDERVGCLLLSQASNAVEKNHGSQKSEGSLRTATESREARHRADDEGLSGDQSDRPGSRYQGSPRGEGVRIRPNPREAR